MYMHQCLAYKNLQGELRLVEDTISVAIKTEGDTTSVMLSYMQLKALSDGIAALLQQVTVEDLMKGGPWPISGDMTMTICLEREKSAEKEVSEPCRQQPFTVQTEDVLLSKSA